MARPHPDTKPDRRFRFEAAGQLVAHKVREAGQKRGFAEARLLTHWPEIAGADLAPLCRPVKISHAKGGLGANLVVLVNGAAAPLVQMRLPALRERINAVYGYNAIARITLTQIAATQLAEDQAPFAHAPKAPDPRIVERAAQVADGVQDQSLRDALERLARNVLTRTQIRKETT